MRVVSVTRTAMPAKLRLREPRRVHAHAISPHRQQWRRKTAIRARSHRALQHTCVLVRDPYLGIRNKRPARILHRPRDRSRGSALGPSLAR